MKKTLLGILFVISTLSFYSDVLAATYWVSTSGSDGNGCNNSGSPLTTTAKASVQAGINCLVQGDSLYIRGGTYTELIRYTLLSDASHPVLISGYQNENPTIRMPSGQPNNLAHVVLFHNGCGNQSSPGQPVDPNACTMYLTITGITFEGIDSPYGGDGIQAFHPHTTIDGVTVQNYAHTAIAGSQGGSPAYIPSYYTIRNNKLLNSGRLQQIGECNDTKGSAIYAGADHELIENNTIDGNRGGGIVLQYDYSRYIIVRNNFISRSGCASPWGCVGNPNDCVDSDGNHIFRTHAKGVVVGTDLSFSIDGKGPIENLIYNNVFYTFSDGANFPGDRADFYYGAYNGWQAPAPTGNVFFNNTCYDIEHCIGMTPGSGNGLDAVNNLLMQSTGNTSVELDSWTGSYVGNMIQPSANGVVVNGPGHDFHLSSNSPAKGAGVTSFVWHRSDNSTPTTNITSFTTTDFDGNPIVNNGAISVGAFAASGPAVATKVVFSIQPQQANVGATMASIQAQLQTPAGDVDTTSTALVTLGLAGTQQITGVTAVSASSAQTSPPTNNPASNAVDGDTSTWWFTKVYPSADAPPHNIILDLGASYSVTSAHYIPRQDGSTGGDIGQYQWLLAPSSPCGSASYTQVATGTWANDSSTKVVGWSATSARCAKLVCLNGDASGNQYCMAAELRFFRSTAGGTLTCTAGLSKNAVAGVVNWGDCSINMAGTYQMTVDSGTLTGDTSTQFNITQPDVPSLVVPSLIRGIPK